MTLLESEVNYFLATISLRIGQFWDVKTTLQTIVSATHGLLKCDRLIICRFEPNGNAIVIVEAISEPQLSVLGKGIARSYFSSSQLEQYRQGFTCYDSSIATQNGVSHRELRQYFNAKTHIVTPILQSKTIQENKIFDSQNYDGSPKALSGDLKAPIPKESTLEQPALWGLLIAHRGVEPAQLNSSLKQDRLLQKPQIDRKENLSAIASSESSSQQNLLWKQQELNLFKQIGWQIAIVVRAVEISQITKQELQKNSLDRQQNQQIGQFLQNVIDRLPIAVDLKDVRQNNFGGFKLWNKVTELIFGIEAAKVLEQTASERFPLQQARDLIRQDLQVLENETLIELQETDLDRENTKPKIFRKIKLPLGKRDRKPEFLLCIAQDITAQKKAEGELQQKTAQLAAFSNNLKQLHRLNTTVYQNFEELLQDHLHTGCQMFGCSTGIVGSIENDLYTIYAIESNIKTLHPQKQVPIEDTLCVDVVREQKTITYSHIGEIETLCSHPIYQNFKFESYIGTPIFVDDLVCATLSFASTKARTPPFSDREIETIEMMAQSIGQAIYSDRIEQKRQQAEKQLAQTKKELEIRVLQRTAELELVNISLQNELQEREQTQLALQASKNSLKESERRWRSLLDNVRLLVVGIDARGKIDYVNPYFLELTGYSAERVIGCSWIDDFVHFRSKKEARKLHRQMVNINFCCFHKYHQMTILNQSGEAKTIAWNTTQLRNFQGVPTGMMCIGEDITERQAIEKMKDEFISVVSHELRTPLTSIRGALGLLSTGALKKDPQKADRVAKIAAESTEHLVRLVDNILQLEKLESSNIELVIQKISINGLIAQAINRVQIIANKEGIKLQASELDSTIYGDCDRLIQVLTNLLSNAIKFSESGSTIWLKARFEPSPNNSSKPSVIFAISDRGRGIPADRLDSIFERFHQVDASDSRRKGGTGLGLAICRSIVQQHGGEIWVQSVYGEGSTFYFSIPVNDS